MKEYKVLLTYKMMDIITVKAGSEEQAIQYAKAVLGGGMEDEEGNDIIVEREPIDEIPSDEEIEAEILE